MPMDICLTHYQDMPMDTCYYNASSRRAHGHLLNYIHSGLICNSQNLKKPRCPSREEWVKKMWYIYTTYYYSAVKNKETRKFEGKWIKLTQAEKDKHGVLTHKLILTVK